MGPMGQKHLIGKGLMMFTEILASKISLPPLRPSLVARLRLVQSLNEGLASMRRLSLVCAPAGFGKTTLVIDWLRQTGCPAVWLSLEQADNDLPRFLAYLGAAFQQVDEEIGAGLRNALRTSQVPAVENMLTGLLNEIASRSDSLILVLDDYHVLTESSIQNGIRYLLDHQPPQLQLVLTTREDPDLPLARLRARDQLTEIRARDLRFSRGETKLFLQEVMGLALSDQDVSVLDGRTEGWAVGLQLAGLSMQKHSDLQAFIADFSGSHRHILDYLTSEVLQQQPESIRSFLMQTSIVDRLHGPLCDAVTQGSDSSQLLAYLEAANLFVIPLDEERNWYRYHPLFSDLLRNQLVRSQPEIISELHRRASCWYVENGDIQAAIDHALQDIDLTLAAHLIERYTFPMLYQGQIALVASWYDRLPHEILESDPMLCISKVWALALMQRGTRSEEIDLALQAAIQALDRVNAGQELRDLVAGHTASIRAFLLRSPWTGETRERLIALSREAQRLLPVEAKDIRSINDLNIGYAYLGLADLEAARLAFQQAQEEGLSGGNFYAAIYGPINLILIALLDGRRREALQLCDTNIDRFNQVLAGQYFPPIGALYILKGSILLEQNQLTEAEQLVTEGLDLIRWTGESVAHRTGYTALARLRMIQRDHAGMLEVVKALEDTLPKEALYAQALRQRLSLRYKPNDPGLQPDARSWLSQSGIDFGDMAAIDSLNPSSAAYFESYLNAAYVMARLEKATPGAYSLDKVQIYLRLQLEFAESHGIVSWVVMIAIVRAVLYLSSGKKQEALKSLEVALRAAEPTGLYRLFVDEYEALGPLLQELKTRLRDKALNGYVSRLLDASSSRPAKPGIKDRHDVQLSERELDVLQDLARGLSYEEIGQHLFLSLNTIQFHVKSIYRKLQVKKRLHAIEKAREINLI
jgi:LuxR family transcriptional regulator, maltose regulon positive regulatory protein